MTSDLMREFERDTDVLVIGAGMAGLIAAAALTRAGARVRVLDKGRSVGGRLASRRIGEATLDHWAQFITARTPWFTGVIEEGRDAGVITEWCRGLAESADGHARWRGHPTMTAVAKYLAHGLEILLERQVEALRRSEARWTAVTQFGEVLSARAVVLTPPVPQSLAILEAGGQALDAETRTRLGGIAYERCLAVMALAAAEPWLGTGILTYQVHGWRYSKPTQVDAQPCLIVSPDPPLVIAGDGFAGPRVEGAALSGQAAAEAILAGAS